MNARTIDSLERLAPVTGSVACPWCNAELADGFVKGYHGWECGSYHYGHDKGNHGGRVNQSHECCRREVIRGLRAVRSADAFGALLVKHNIIQAAAYEDPVGYDNFVTLCNIENAWREICPRNVENQATASAKRDWHDR